MDYVGQIYRPPSERNSILLQITVGCSHNKCGFCEMYRDKEFRVKSWEQITADLDYAAIHYQNVSRLFLCDGDAMVLSQKKLVRLLTLIAETLPWVQVISAYVYEKNLQNKTVEDLKELRNLNLKMLHMGLESGHAPTLAFHGKQSDPSYIVQQGRKIKDAGIKLSLTVLLGLGGARDSMVHAKETGIVISQIDPNYVGVLSLMITPNTPLYAQWKNGEFEKIEYLQELKELRELLVNTSMSKGVFSVNHASNKIPIQARMPREKGGTLAFLDKTITMIHSV
ncbi:MAG: radical SAM protein [Fibrobacterales bacterium]